jgi:hypothetical protein
MSPGADRVFVRVLELESGSARKKLWKRVRKSPKLATPLDKGVRDMV